MPSPSRPSHPFLAVLPVLAASCLAGPATAAESFDGCTHYIDTVPAVIASPGYWCLRGDVATAQASGNAIKIDADDVTLDCNDYKVGGLGAGIGTSALGIAAFDGRRDVTIRRCNVRGFRVGLYLYAANALVEDNRVDGNTEIGILSQGDRARIRRNFVVDTGGSTTVGNASVVSGIYFGSETEVSGNTILGVRTSNAAGMTYGIQGRDMWLATPVLGSITGNRVAGVEATAQGLAVGISAGIGGAVVADNAIIGGGTDDDAGILCHDPHDASIARGNTLIGFTINAFTCIDGGGNVSL